eukprot:m.126904 g.126904  ORF g.126904 m.126904 type:complete len:72 (-) comp13845_c1_seq5:103-318(-)
MPKVKAKFAYTPTNDTGLPFSAGQILEVVKSDPSGWTQGSFDGVTGWFPSSYVEPYEVRSFSLLHGISLLF